MANRGELVEYEPNPDERAMGESTVPAIVTNSVENEDGVSVHTVHVFGEHIGSVLHRLVLDMNDLSNEEIEHGGFIHAIGTVVKTVDPAVTPEVNAVESAADTAAVDWQELARQHGWEAPVATNVPAVNPAVSPNVVGEEESPKE